MRYYFLMVILVLVLLSTNTLAWTSDTHRWICNHAGLSGLDCANADIPAIQKNYSGLGFVNHHCANNDSDCTARKVAMKFQTMHTTMTDGFAAHLYADSLVPVHWYSLDYYSCHKIFEDRVEEELRNAGTKIYILFGDTIDTTHWSFTMTCVDTKGISHELTAGSDYMDAVTIDVAEKMGSTPQETSPEIVDVTPVIIVVVVIALLLVVLLIIFGRKKRKNN